MAPKYMSGFGNSFETEALPGALPGGRNSPQKVSYGLYAEQISGSPFTAPQATNERTWLYRIRPTVRHTGRFQKIDKGAIRTAPERDDTDLPIGQLRWSPTPLPKRKLTFVTGMHTITTAGDAEAQTGMAAHVLLITASMEREHFFNADGPTSTLLFFRSAGRWLRTRSGRRGTIATLCRNLWAWFMEIYDAKPEGFVPGGMSLHNQMLPHGPDADAFEHASNSELKPVKLTNTLAFMFDSRFRQRVTKYAATLPTRQDDYVDCWKGLKTHFNRKRRNPK